ncbi:GNAT family N-acetyltransferase [Bacillus manliponensis]|uniref:GNAT family N-acetyltransferase n=1 Tax=Bacillus manliponensis TaxID=574376 RepID=UPI003516C51B
MIYKLNKNDYFKIKPLLEISKRTDDIALNAIINGTNRGAVYVDNVKNPKTALVDVIGINSMLIGDSSNEYFIPHLRDFVEGQLKIDTYESCGGTYFLTVLNDEDWEKVLGNVFSHREYEWDYELYYQLQTDQFHIVKQSYKGLPDGYTLEKIDCNVIQDDPNHTLHDVLSEVWYSIDDFIEYGFGYCVMKGKEVVSACFSCTVNGSEHEISVETYDEDEMGKGLATAACTAYLEECLRNGMIPIWSTLETNVESVHLAEKLGFQSTHKRKTFEFEF